MWHVRRWLWLPVLVLAALFWMLRPAQHASQQTLPNPNGYDDFVAAFAVLTPNPGDWHTQSVSELRGVLAQNSNALALIRRGLGKSARIPLQGRTPSNLLSNLGPAKATALLLVAESRAASGERNTNAALQSIGDCLLFAHKSSDGGLMIDYLVALAIESLAAKEATGLIEGAAPETVHHFSERLGAIDHSREKWEDITSRDHEWARAHANFIQAFWQRVVLWQSIKQAQQKFRARYERSVADLRLLRIRCALREYRNDTGRVPQRLEELVPRYLEAVPADPLTGAMPSYRAGTNSYSLFGP